MIDYTLIEQLLVKYGDAEDVVSGNAQPENYDWIHDGDCDIVVQ